MLATLSGRVRLAAALALGLALSGCATVPITGRSQLSLVSESELIALGADDYQQLMSSVKVSKDQAKTRLVTEVGTKIAQSTVQFLKANGLGRMVANYKWEFALIEDDSVVNAFCMPGGKIGVYTGILPVTQNATGLAVVVSHEVAHAVANHSGERVSQLLLTQLGGAALSQAIQQKPSETQELLMLAYGVGANVGVLLPYSRKHESEADRIGLILMAQAGYNPEAAVPFWQRMAARGQGAPPEFLSTHPSHATRIDDLNKWMPEALGYYAR